jgi:hypothetical protein
MDDYRTKLITKNRIDTIVGIKYCESYDKLYNTSFFHDLYISYKYAFNGLKETSGTSNETYKNRQDFLNRFNSLIESIKQTKANTELIPIIHTNNEYWMVDGFHRLSVLTYFGFDINMSINNNPMIPPPSQAHNLPLNLNNYNWYPTNIQFFSRKGLNQTYTDYIMYTFLKNYKKSFSCVVLFPTNKDLPSDIVNKFNIIYTKTIDKYENNFKKNFIEMLYFTEKWCVNGGAINKASACFRHQGNIQILFIEKKELSELQQIKETIRQFYNDRNSIHIPDTQEENNNLLQLLNYNTIEYYNKTPSLYNNFKNFNLYLHKLTSFCITNNIDTDYICVEGSSVLSSYKIRDCGDMDLLIDKKYVDSFKNTEFDNHNIYTIKGEKNYFCPLHFEDIIHNPNNHYFFKGIKFCNLSIIKQCKTNRIANNLFNHASILKDKADLHNIEQIV